MKKILILVIALLISGGSTMAQVLQQPFNKGELNPYGKYFTGKPARSCVAVKTLPKNVLCEVEAIAEI